MKATEEQIRHWKEQYKCKIFEFSTKEEKEEDRKRAYFRAIPLSVLDAQSNVRKTSELRADEVIIENCWLGGDECIKNEDYYKLGLKGWLGMLVVAAEGEMVEI
jgi:hypothetical protein